MKPPRGGAPPPEMKRAALGREAARGNAVAVGTANRTPPPQSAQPGLSPPAGGSPLHLPDFAARFRVGPYVCVFQICDGAIKCEWDPMPRRLSRTELAEYRSRRNAALVQFAYDSDIRITVFDV